MKIAYYIPNVVSIGHQKRFCKYTKYDWLINECDESVDLIYAGSISILEPALMAAKKYNKPIICWVWDIPYKWRDWVKNDIVGYQANLFRDFQIQRNIQMLEECNLVLSASKYTHDVLLKVYNIPSKQVYWYYDSESIDKIPEQVKEDQIIQISRYFFNKRFEISIHAVAQTPYKLVCVGFGKDYCQGRLTWLTAVDVAHEDVEFYVGIPREDTVRHLKKSKLLVSPSIFEGWGITPIEALHCNIPVLLSDLPVFKEVYGKDLVYHKRDDIYDMANKINLIMNDKDLQDKIVSIGKDKIKNFTAKRFAQRFTNIIENTKYV